MNADGRWRAYPLAVVVALLLAVVVTSVSAADRTGARGLGGDLPEFIGAGRIVADGDAIQLYEPARQMAAQADLWDEGQGGILFAYPALLAAPYALVASWSFVAIYLVHTAVMVAAVVVTARLLADRLPLTAGRSWIPLGVAASLTFLPMFIGTFNGQLTGVVLLGLVATWVLLLDGRDGAAGLVAGLLLLKPQYGGLVALLLAVAGRWKALPGFAVGAAVVAGGSALVAGPGWFGRWWELVGSLSDIDGGSNLASEVSWLGLSEALLGQGAAAATVVGVGLSAATLVVTLRLLRGRDVADPLVPALVLPTLLLVAPHSLYYDAGILLVALAALLPSLPAGRRAPVALAWWAFGFSHSLLGGLAFEPVALLVLGTWAWAASRCRHEELVPRVALA